METTLIHQKTLNRKKNGIQQGFGEKGAEVLN